MLFPIFDTPPTDGSWLTDNPHYQKWVEKLSSSDPRLRRRNPKGVLRHIPWPTPFTRMVVFEANSAKQITWKQTTFTHPAAFRESLSTPTDPDGRRIIVLEGQTPSYIGILGMHFGIHPTLFVDHERESIPEAFQTDGELEIIPLPSTLKEHVSIKYYELLYLPPETRGFRLFCAETGRGLSTTRILGEFSDTGALHRRCSVWRRARAGGKGWDSIIITDPPLRSVRTKWGSLTAIPLSPIPHQGGYLDFVPHQNQLKVGSGPPQTSMLDDIVFYLTKHPDLFNPNSTEDMPLRLVQKIVASHYRKKIGFLHCLISYLQHSMSRQEKLDIFSPTIVEKQWSDVQAYERRVSYYCLNLDSIMIQCGIPLSSSENFSFPGVGAVQPRDDDRDAIANDFRFLRATLRDVQRRVELVSSSITGLAGIAGNRQTVVEQMLSRQEARSMKALTIVGLVFLPLSFAASLFSMTEPYSFGEDRFWVYFAISVPLCVLAFAIYFLFGGSWARRSHRIDLRRDRSDSVC